MLWNYRTLTLCWSVLDTWIKLEKSSSMNWIFSLFRTGFLLPVHVKWACKNQFQNWFLQVKNPVYWTGFFKPDFSRIKYRWIKRVTGWKIASWDIKTFCHTCYPAVWFIRKYVRVQIRNSWLTISRALATYFNVL